MRTLTIEERDSLHRMIQDMKQNDHVEMFLGTPVNEWDDDSMRLIARVCVHLWADRVECRKHTDEMIAWMHKKCAELNNG